MDKRELFTKLAEAVSGTITKKEFKDAFSIVLDVVKKGISTCEGKFKDTKDYCQKMSREMEAKYAGLDKRISTKLATLKDGTNGKDGRDGKDGLDGVDGKDGKDGSPDTGEQIIKKINDSDGQIDSERIKGLDEKIKKNTKGSMSFVSGPRGIDILVGGSVKAHSQYVNFIAGSGISITSNVVGERLDLTITASGSGAFSVLTATGTIDDSNKDFVFASEPTLIIINGAAYTSTGGAITWTWNSGTTTATLSQPVGTGGNIYALA